MAGERFQRTESPICGSPNEFFAGLQFNHADPKRCAHHGRKARAIRVQNAAIAAQPRVGCARTSTFRSSGQLLAPSW